MKPFDYQKPETLKEFFEIEPSPENMILAGGTDILPKIHYGSINPGRLVDISKIHELNFIREEKNDIQLGSLTPFARILESDLVHQFAPLLTTSVLTIGAPMTRSKATIGGNIANASPAGDTLSPLLVLDANLKLVNKTKMRLMPVCDFFTGPGQTALDEGELIHTIIIPKAQGWWGTAFKKTGPRRGMTIAIANVAVLLVIKKSGEISSSRVACGSVAPTPIRCAKTECFLRNKLPSKGLWQEAAQIAVDETAPISDVRGSNDYRMKLIKSLVQTCLQEAHDAALERGKQ
jgi:CO/xanthine dehydrogenase FAD-binding subunit